MEDRCLELFRALADTTRQEILQLLAEHERSVSNICNEFEDMTQPTISHHLQILKRCELVDTQRKGKMIYYSINKRVLRNGIEEFIARFGIQVL
jgi:DNA-binding transcriptional ArsR family regulator